MTTRSKQVHVGDILTDSELHRLTRQGTVIEPAHAINPDVYMLGSDGRWYTPITDQDEPEGFIPDDGMRSFDASLFGGAFKVIHLP